MIYTIIEDPCIEMRQRDLVKMILESIPLYEYKGFEERRDRFAWKKEVYNYIFDKDVIQ